MAELAKPAWFDSKRIAQATFQSTRVKANGPGEFEVLGKLRPADGGARQHSPADPDRGGQAVTRRAPRCTKRCRWRKRRFKSPAPERAQLAAWYDTEAEAGPTELAWESSALPVSSVVGRQPNRRHVRSTEVAVDGT
jgi:hypothetical protein